MKRIGQATVAALAEIGALEDPEHCRAEAESADGLLIGVWMQGGTMRDKTTFACCMEELWGIIDNPRYLSFAGYKADAGQRVLLCAGDFWQAEGAGADF